MVVIFSKQFKKIAFLSLFLISSLQFVYSNNVDIPFNEPALFVEQDEKAQKLSFDISPEIKKEDYTQSLSHLSYDEHRSNIYENSFDKKLEALGKDAFSEFVVDPIVKEIELRDDYYVFYHGQKREFLLIQDLFARLNEIVRKKVLKDFVMLRIPDKDHKKFKNVKQFLNEYKKEMKDFSGWFDGQSHINKILLSVNPFLFGNSSWWLGSGSCTFAYFLNSQNVFFGDVSSLIKNLFESFNLNLDTKYDTQISELVKLLKKYEKKKTGLLLQIFVPKDIVNEVSYRCVPGGDPYHDNFDKKTSKDLSKYQGKKDTILDKYLLNSGRAVNRYLRLGLYSYWVPFELLRQVSDTWSYKLSGNKSLYYLASQPLAYLSEKCYDISDHAYKKFYEEKSIYWGADAMQYRILLSEDVMLNPDSGVKIFRYCNETEAVQEYKIKLDKLLSDISRDYQF